MNLLEKGGVIMTNDNAAVACSQRDYLSEWGRDVFSSILNALKSFAFDDAPSSKAEESARTRSVRDCVLVIDASGSMLDDDWKPTRLDAAKKAAHSFVRRLSQEQPDARVAVVAFGCRASVACQLTPARELDMIGHRIDQIDIEGSTNMYAGLKAASRLLKGSRASQVVLLTDGQNTGRDPETLADSLKSFAVIECVGIGGSPCDVDEPLLRRIASTYPNGRKRYRWIGQKEQLIKHFHNLAGAIRRA